MSEQLLLEIYLADTVYVYFFQFPLIEWLLLDSVTTH